MEDQRDELKKRINPSVEALFDMNCKRHEELIRKRQIIQQNKEQLEQAITVLDAERQKDVKRTIGQVEKHFNDIFSALLPGTGARLHQIFEDDNNQLKGLRLGVSFNGVEKASLTELSGGQRSLLALSLILALLKFQPAPFYILDEIDSALDLSHTQNIGQMIRKYFQSSQFIVVSLKEGLF